MPRATPFDVYYWRRKHMRGTFAVYPVKPPSQFRVNVFIQFTTSTTPDLLPHLTRFANSVNTNNIYSPLLVVALMIAARLFPNDWRRLLSPPLAISERTARDVARFNEANPVVGADELLEMTQLVRDFLRPPLDVVQRSAQRYDAFIDPATLEVFGRSSAAAARATNTSDNDAYRIGMLLVLMRASPALGADGWDEFMRYLRWSGVVLTRPLARLNRLFLEARVASKDEVRALLAQFGVSKLRYAQQLQVLSTTTTNK